MELAAVVLARASAWVESYDLNPRGKLFYPDLAKAVATRYNFQKFPQKIEDFDEAKGVVFAEGKLGNSVIEQVIVYSFGVVLETRISTQESKRLLEEAFDWASKELGLTYKPSMVKRWQYYSQVTFYSKAPFLGNLKATQKLAQAVTNHVAELTDEDLKYELTSLTLNYDQLTRKHPLGSFSIQRRENTPFSDNKYFSDAPLPTETHIKLLEQFEADLSGQ